MVYFNEPNHGMWCSLSFGLVRSDQKKNCTTCHDCGRPTITACMASMALMSCLATYTPGPMQQTVWQMAQQPAAYSVHPCPRPRPPPPHHHLGPQETPRHLEH